MGKAKPGDHLVFTFSSHGTQVPSQPGDPDEPDGLDEAFACYDLKQGGDDWDRKTVIVDDELRDLFATVPEGVLARGVARHLPQRHRTEGSRRHPAGDAPRSSTAVPATADPKRAEPRPLHPRARDHARSTARRSCELTKTKGAGAKPVLYAACRPDQTAADARFDSRPNGAFTYLFLKALAQDPAQTRAQLHSTITKGLKSEDFEQRSTLEGPAKAKKVAFGQPW